MLGMFGYVGVCNGMLRVVLVYVVICWGYFCVCFSTWGYVELCCCMLESAMISFVAC